MEKCWHNLYGSHHKCSYHGDRGLSDSVSEPTCLVCDTLTEAKKKALPGGYHKVKKIKTRIQVREAVDDFLFDGGTYQSHLTKMYHHIAHVMLLGSRSCGKMCRIFSQEDNGVVLMEEDYAEKYQGTPNGEIQSECSFLVVKRRLTCLS